MLPKTNPIFDRYIIAYRYTILYERVIADITVGANDDVFLDVSERPYASASADIICFHQCLLVNKCYRFCIVHNFKCA